MINFEKHNKGLRAFATLFDIDPKVFDTDNFIDVEAKFITKDLPGKLIIYYRNLPSREIQRLLKSNKSFFNISIDEPGKIGYVFEGDKEIDSKFKLMGKTGCTYFWTNSDFINMCILWKNYIDASFHSIVSRSITDWVLF